MAQRVQVTVTKNEAAAQAETAEDRHGRYGYVRPEETDQAAAYTATCNACPWTATSETKGGADQAAKDHKAQHRAEAKENTAR
jgi:hypothetical protein